MSAPLAVSALIFLVVGAHLLAERLTRARVAPVAVLALLLGLAALELARHDYGHGDAFFAVAFVAAPVAAIFAGALWGSRRFYGWPDLGALPGRTAVVAGAILVGVLAGTQVRDQRDVPESQRRAQEIRSSVLAWRERNGGRWPDTLAQAGVPETRSAMGSLAPPALGYDLREGRARVLVPLSRGRRLALDLEKDAWTEEAVR